MRTVLRSMALVLLVLGVASQASAGDRVWSVTGVVNDGLATVFTCTNGGSAAVNVKVEIFDPSGAAHVQGTLNVAPGATVDFGTKLVSSLNPPGVDMDLGASTLHSGSARITAASGVFCSAYVTDPLNSPPTSMRTLSVIKKTTQKGD